MRSYFNKEVEALIYKTKINGRRLRCADHMTPSIHKCWYYLQQQVAAAQFWYENPSVFKPEQLTQIKQSTLSSVLCNNGDDISDITHDVFVLPAEQPSRLVSCTEVRQMDLRFWTECCNDCSNSGEFNSITQLSSARSRRDLGFSYPSDKPQRAELLYSDKTMI
ncbi:unnamed protein product, partial [Timema podura]|nr:unnamed protein product [Timema podura]